MLMLLQNFQKFSKISSSQPACRRKLRRLLRSTMSVTVIAALSASIGSLLQGWDFAAMSGANPYVGREFRLDSKPTLAGLIVAMPLVGGITITAFTAVLSDKLGRRFMLILSALMYLLGGALMLWSPGIAVLIAARLVYGFGLGITINVVSVYISETSPPAIRGLLNTIPQFMFSGGLFVAYLTVYGITSSPEPNWRLMIGAIVAPAAVFAVLAAVLLPESPRWLVSKGRMSEARAVLRKLRGSDDVTGDLALLVEGLTTAGKTTVEEYIVSPPAADDGIKPPAESKITLYAPEAGVSWVALPVTAPMTAPVPVPVPGAAARRASFIVDPVVSLFDSVHGSLPQSKGQSFLFSNTASALAPMAPPARIIEQWDVENARERQSHAAAAGDGREVGGDDSVHVPLLTPQLTAEGSLLAAPGGSLEPRGGGGASFSSAISTAVQSLLGTSAPAGETVGSVGIGGGWQLAWRDDSGGDGERKPRRALKKVFLREGQATAAPATQVSSINAGGAIHATALVSQSVLDPDELHGRLADSAMAEKPREAVEQTMWEALRDPGIRSALIVGMAIQIIQQFSGVGSLLRYNPTFLESAGVVALLPNTGMSPHALAIVISSVMAFLMLPFIVVAMRLMDASGRRGLLLATIPVQMAALTATAASNTLQPGTAGNAMLSLVAMTVCFGAYAMGLGPITGLYCSEIFPTSVRAKCMMVCMLTYYASGVAATVVVPAMLASLGLSGTMAVYAAVCAAAFVFVFVRVPETKGLPIEVIVDLFRFGAQKN